MIKINFYLFVKFSITGAYSQAVVAANQYSTVYLSGTIPLDKDGKLINGTIEEQTRQVFTNMKSKLYDISVQWSHYTIV